MQHQKLISIINNLHSAMQMGKGQSTLSEILEELVTYTKTHFAEEEAFLRLHHYSGLDRQLKSHAGFVDKITEMYEGFRAGRPLAVNVFEFLKDWLIRHIQTADKKYGEELGQKQVARKAAEPNMIDPREVIKLDDNEFGKY